MGRCIAIGRVDSRRDWTRTCRILEYSRIISGHVTSTALRLGEVGPYCYGQGTAATPVKTDSQYGHSQQYYTEVLRGLWGSCHHRAELIVAAPSF